MSNSAREACLSRRPSTSTAVVLRVCVIVERISFRSNESYFADAVSPKLIEIHHQLPFAP